MGVINLKQHLLFSLNEIKMHIQDGKLGKQKNKNYHIHQSKVIPVNILISSLSLLQCTYT